MIDSIIYQLPARGPINPKSILPKTLAMANIIGKLYPKPKLKLFSKIPLITKYLAHSE